MKETTTVGVDPTPITPTAQQRELAALAVQIAVKAHEMGIQGAIVVLAVTAAGDIDCSKCGALIHVRVDPEPAVMSNAWFEGAELKK